MAGTSHFADAMRHPRTQVALAQFPISPADGVVLPALLVPIVRLCPSAYRYHRTYLSSTKRGPTQDLQPPLRCNAPSPYFYEYPTNSNCVSVSRGTFLCDQFARQSTWDDASERRTPCITAHHKTKLRHATRLETDLSPA